MAEFVDLVTPGKTPVNELPAEALQELFKEQKDPAPQTRTAVEQPHRYSTDALVVGFCLSLAALSAVFPWYIFFNPEKFGVQPLVLSQHGDGQSDFKAAAAAALLIDIPELDFIPTGTIKPAVREAAPNQPFPGDAAANFRLLHVANGRAMIEDDQGFWIVQRGSVLPDGSRVAQILHKGGDWILITSERREVALVR